MNRGELKELEGRIRSSLVSLHRRSIPEVTMIEVVDDAAIWPEAFSDFSLKNTGIDLDDLIAHAPLLVCAIASEIGFRFEGVGTIFWARFGDVIGYNASAHQRQLIANIFRAEANRYNLARPAQSAFAEHFSNIAWPIANALMPYDLIGPVSRLLSRAPVGALPGAGRSPNFVSLRAWASAAEGARLADWLRVEAPATRVLTALLMENRGEALSSRSYQRLQEAIASQHEAYFAARAARLRAFNYKSSLAEPAPGQLSLTVGAAGLRMFASWPALPVPLFDEAQARARSAAWRPRIWNAGSLLHPDNALSPGPFALVFNDVPGDDEPAYPGVATIFGEGSEAATALAARTILWTPTLLFDPNQDRNLGEQRFNALTERAGYVWIATRADGASLQGLRRLGHVCGYDVFEADLAAESDRTILTRAHLINSERHSLIARHPTDAINAPYGIVRPDRPFLLYSEESVGQDFVPQKLSQDGSSAFGLRTEPISPGLAGVIDLVLFERDNLFEALVERRVQLRLESSLLLINVPVVADLEIGGRLIARGRASFAAVPTTVPDDSRLLAPLYADHAREKLLEFGKASLRIAVHHSVVLQVQLLRPQASVEWTEDGPRPTGTDFDTQLVQAQSGHPHRFESAATVEQPVRGAIAYALRFPDGRLADPIQILAPSKFELGDLAAHFGEDLGSRRMFANGRGVGDVARALVAWSRGICVSLSGVAAKTRIVRQFQEPLVISLCGQAWWLAEGQSLSDPTDAYAALWQVALQRGLISVPEAFAPDDILAFAGAFRRVTQALDLNWPTEDQSPADGVMDDALNRAFAEVVLQRHSEGKLLDIDPDDVDFGSPAEDWERAATEALRNLQRPRLCDLMAPSGGARELSHRSYADLSIPELAEDLSAWTHRWALMRARMSPDIAANALQLWLSPSACDDVDRATHTLAVDPFVARAVRYAALRFPRGSEGNT